MPDHLLQTAEMPQPVWKRKLRRAGRELSLWYRNLMVSVLEMAILFAATVVIFAAMFFRIAMDPVRFRELILYGVGLKVAYCSLVFKYAITEDVPAMWIPWAWLDLVFLVVFLLAWYRIGKLTTSG